MHILYDYAMQFVGKPYMWGGDDPLAGFDCSGLAIELLQAAGVLPPKYDTTAQGLFLRCRGTDGIVTTADFGYLAFYGANEEKITHVAFCMDNYFMLEAGGGGSETLTIEDAIKQNAYIRLRPIRSRKDLVAIGKVNLTRALRG